MPRLTLVALLLCVSACGTNPADCYEAGNEKACNDLCNTGEVVHMAACFELRTRTVAACVDGKGDCGKACELWQNAALDDTIRSYYVAKLGSESKVAAIETKCGAAKRE